MASCHVLIARLEATAFMVSLCQGIHHAKVGLVAHACDPSYEEAKTGGIMSSWPTWDIHLSKKKRKEKREEKEPIKQE